MFTKPDQPSILAASIEASGYCHSCRTTHRLGIGNSHQAALALMAKLEHSHNIDIFNDSAIPDPRLSTLPLFGAGRGKMFGVLEGVDRLGNIHMLYAFSGQYNGQYLVEGWAPPLFDVEKFTSLTVETDKKIKDIGRSLDALPRHSAEWLKLRRQRRELSRCLMRKIHDLYQFTNFKGEKRPLAHVFTGTAGIPTGTGDCCSPKLLHYAARNGLRPRGLCEFFWGRENKSRTAFHQQFHGPCEEKCAPILGFMLCGL